MPDTTDPRLPDDLDVRGCLSVDEALAVCDGDDAPATGAARGHIERCERCRSLVAEAARAVVDLDRDADPSVARVSSLLTLREGEQVAGRYRIVRFLARGGMGEVYEAFDQLLQEPVAIKTLVATALDDERAIARLMLEVRLARRVTHPNVCRILEIGFHAPVGWRGARLPFLTMELLSGESLSRRLARVGPLSPGEALVLARQMVAGLAAIHAAGIVHRDWKTDNAFLAGSAGGIERLVVMDFGLAHAPVIGRSASSASGVPGTADYIAPEQLRGGALTPAADIYALGVVLYEMVTGQRPFSGTSLFETALNRFQHAAPAPGRLVPGLPAAWDRAVLGCLELRPERRPARVQDVLELLEAGGGRHTSRTGWRRLAPGRLAAVGAGTAGALLLAAAVAGLALRGRTAEPPPAPPVAVSRAPMPPPVPPVSKPALLGMKWPTREIPVCVQAVDVAHDPQAAVFNVRAMLDFSWNYLADFWFHDAGSCPPNPRGMVALSLAEGNHHRADLGYRPDGPVRVHLGVEPAGQYDRVVHAFGRALGLGLRGDRVLSSEEIMFVRTVYGRKPPGSLAGPWGRCITRTAGKASASLSRCTGGADETWQREAAARQLRDPGTSTCLAAGEASARRQPLLVSPCQGRAGETISMRGTSWRAVGDRCVTANAARPDASIGVAGCDRSALQRWDFFEGDGRIRLFGTDLCVTAPENAVELGVGTRLALQPCGARGGGQRFVLAAGGLIKLDPALDLCLNMSMGSPRVGVLSLGTWCHRVPPSADQVFTIAGPLRIAGGCVTVPGGPDDHAAVWVSPCVGGWDHQIWEYWW